LYGDRPCGCQRNHPKPTTQPDTEPAEPKGQFDMTIDQNTESPEPQHESTFKLTGAAVIPTDRAVLPPKTMAISGGPGSLLDGMPLWGEDEIDAARPSKDHYLVFAAVWVPGQVLDES
jgi:hypothetical protein